jgi:hypothetical protein
MDFTGEDHTEGYSDYNFLDDNTQSSVVDVDPMARYSEVEREETVGGWGRGYNEREVRCTL